MRIMTKKYHESQRLEKKLFSYSIRFKNFLGGFCPGGICADPLFYKHLECQAFLDKHILLATFKNIFCLSRILCSGQIDEHCA